MAQQLWEATKMEAQRAFADIGSKYQEILIAGHIYPFDRSGATNMEIAEASYEKPEAGSLVSHREAGLDGPERQSFEPEM